MWSRKANSSGVQRDITKNETEELGEVGRRGDEKYCQ